MTVPGDESYLAEGVWNHNTGKTRSGAEWLIDRTIRYPVDASGFPTERLVIAETLSDARSQCIEGPSGVLRCLERREIEFHYTKSPKPKIVIKETGAKIHFVGADPDKVRGFNLADVWADEICKWANSRLVWYEGILPALRAKVSGDQPRAFITTTPKPDGLLLEWVDRSQDPEQAHLISMATGSTYDNADNLSEAALDELTRRYEGTDLGRQELMGEIIELGSGKLFKQVDINAARVEIGPLSVGARVVGVDPSLTVNTLDGSDEMGVVVACRGPDNHMYVIADESQELTGREAALHIWRVFALYEADVVVYENNLGKAWMKKVLEDVYYELREEGLFEENTTPPLKPVHSNQGKVTRAEPVALRCQQKRLHMIGKFPELEKQLVTFDPLSSKNSPDRMDAMVHACRWLMEGEKKKVKVASPAKRRMSGMGTFNSNANPYGLGYVPGA